MLDFFICLASLVALSRIFVNLEFYPPKNLADRLFIHYPFTIYAGWVFIATFLNLWISVRALNTVPLSTAAILFIGLIGLYFIDYHERHDVILAATFVWSLIGIAVRNYEILPILIAAITSASFILGGIIHVWVRYVVAWFRLRHRRLDENSPLLA